MKRHLPFLLLIIVSACIRENEIPEGVLSQRKMSEILMEVHLLESKIEYLNISIDSAKQVYQHFEPLVFEKYGVDSATYRQSLDFYLRHPVLMHEIYEVVVDSMMVRSKSERIE